MTMRDKEGIRRARRAVIRAIKRHVAPHLRDSGYKTAVVPGTPIGHPSGRRPVRMWTPPDGWVDLPKTFKLLGFYALSEFGPVVDAYGGGAVFESYSDFPLEDLLSLRAWVERNIARVTS